MQSHNPSYYSPPRITVSPRYQRRARPRAGFVAQVIDVIRRVIRDGLRYLKENPTKIFIPIVMALVSGGGLAALAKRFGVRLPAMFGAGGALGRGMQGGYDAWGRFDGGARHPIVRNLFQVVKEFL